jgi:hypothetical protein
VSALHVLPVWSLIGPAFVSGARSVDLQDRHLVTQPGLSGLATGLSRPSFARTEDVRAIDTSRLVKRRDRTPGTLAAIRKVLGYFLVEVELGSSWRSVRERPAKRWDHGILDVCHGQ